jgi:hypothetical protein
MTPTTAKNQSKWIYIILFAILIIVVLLVIFGFKLGKKKQDAEVLRTTPTPTPNPTSINTGVTGGTIGTTSVVPDYNKRLYKGMPKCREVEILQTQLNSRGASLSVDGIFGAQTEAALQLYTGSTTATLNDLAITPASGVGTTAIYPQPAPTDSSYDAWWNPFTWKLY